MISPDECLLLLNPDGSVDPADWPVLTEIGFENPALALRRLREVCRGAEERELFSQTLPALLHALHEAADPDGSLVNFERHAQAVKFRGDFYRELASQPRAVEILVKLFVGSQFLTEILLKYPEYLAELTRHKRLAEFKSRNELIEQGRAACAALRTLEQRSAAMRRFQQWEVLRIAACDTFGLMDLKSVTLQLSLLADALVQIGLDLVCQELRIEPGPFCVLACGKLGGEELNYSSDIDLVFVCDGDPAAHVRTAQRLIKLLTDATHLGFLYRVDMRLRPWGAAGALVTTAGAYVDYLSRHAALWEKQALLKSRCIAGDHELGQSVLSRLEPIVYDVSPSMVRQNVLQMKRRIEEEARQRGTEAIDVKGGIGGIRDIEFLTQGLQQAFGGEQPLIRSRNTLDALVRLSDAQLVNSEDYRRLSSGYMVLRTIEHSLQLMHNRQEHVLPRSERGLAYLARRLDFADVGLFLTHFRQHQRAVREVFEQHLVHDPLQADESSRMFGRSVDQYMGASTTAYHQVFNEEQSRGHVRLLESLQADRPARVEARDLGDERWEVTIAGFDRLGGLTMICGLLFVYGGDIESGFAFTGSEVGDVSKFLDQFLVRRLHQKDGTTNADSWSSYERELRELLALAQRDARREWQGRLARRVAKVMEPVSDVAPTLLPVEVEIDNDSSRSATVLHIKGDDTPGFLYELTNALATTGVSIMRMVVRSNGKQVVDTLHVVDARTGKKIEDVERLRALRAAIVVIKHFTHLLPRSPNPEAALVHFQEFLEQQLAQPAWVDQLASLQDSRVLDALARLLGVSDFLWEDFLKMQHENLFPVLADVQGLQHARSQQSLRDELRSQLLTLSDEECRAALNAFKDREMLRIDMRHILGLQDKFGMFSQELTELAEVIVEAAAAVCDDQLRRDYGAPMLGFGRASRLAICALGKFGGQELGYASDIELMFIYDADGFTSGPDVISNLEYYQHLVEAFRKFIDARRKGIFEVDLRLRPFGNSGSLAVSLASFEKYFGPEGPAWPYERQALVKLRPIAGNMEFRRTISDIRDSLIYRGIVFDVPAMRAMRERQIRQLVKPNLFNAKLSPGGLVDCEYLVQGLQISLGHLDPELRHPNTREAMKALEKNRILSRKDRLMLRDAYRFLRRLIDALRMVRGDASDLTVPPHDTDEFEFLARRLGYGANLRELKKDIERHSTNVLELGRLLDQLASR